jgi:hypothetical protein
MVETKVRKIPRGSLKQEKGQRSEADGTHSAPIQGARVMKGKRAQP